MSCMSLSFFVQLVKCCTNGNSVTIVREELYVLKHGASIVIEELYGLIKCLSIVSEVSYVLIKCVTIVS